MDKDIFFIVTFIAFIILTFVTIFFASIIIFTTIYYWKTQTRSISNLLICNSSATLLYYSIATSIQLPYLFISHPRSFVLCQIQAFVHFSSCVIIAYSCLIQAISRFFIIILYQRKSLLTYRATWILILFNWLIGVVLAGLLFLSSISYQYESESRMCVITSKVFLSSFIGINIAFCIPLMTTIVLYAIILHHTTQTQGNSNAFVIMRLKRNVKVFRNIFLFTLILSIGGIPYFISVLINSNNHSPWPLYSLSGLCVSFSTLLESLALFFTSIQVKTLFYTTVKCIQPLE